MNGTGTFPRGSAGTRTADRSCSVSPRGREGEREATPASRSVETLWRDVPLAPITGWDERKSRKSRSKPRVSKKERKKKRGRNTGLSVELKRSVQIIDSLISGWGNTQWFSRRQRLHCSICSYTGRIQRPVQWWGGALTGWHCVAISHHTLSIHEIQIVELVFFCQTK